MVAVPSKYSDATVARILAELAEGKSLRSICAADGMPKPVTVWRWMRADDELAEQLLEAREAGFQNYAEETIELVESCGDPLKARVILDARRWYLGKLSRAFAEKPLAFGALVNVDAGDAFAAIAGALEKAASTISGGGTCTRRVVDARQAGSSDAAGRLADLVGDGGPGMG